MDIGRKNAKFFGAFSLLILVGVTTKELNVNDMLD